MPWTHCATQAIWHVKINLNPEIPLIFQVKKNVNLHRDSKAFGKGLQILHIHAIQAIWMHFSQVKINKKWNFGCFLNSPWQKMKNKFNLNREKVFQKACKSAHVGFWVCQLQCTMLELCVTSTFWVIMVFLHFTGRSRYRVLKHGVWVKWDPRRTAAYVPSHFNSFEPHFMLCVS